jgi:hypothetical protein
MRDAVGRPGLFGPADYREPMPGDRRGRGKQANTWDRRDAFAGFILTMPSAQALLDLLDLRIEVCKAAILLAQRFD